MDKRRRDVSVKGFYYNLDKSPHVWESPCGDTFKLPSAKRVEMMEKQVPQALARLDKLLDAHNLRGVMPDELQMLLRRYVIQAVYDSIVKR